MGTYNVSNDIITEIQKETKVSASLLKNFKNRIPDSTIFDKYYYWHWTNVLYTLLQEGKTK